MRRRSPYFGFSLPSLRLSDEVNEDFPRARAIIEVEQDNLLPGAKKQPAAFNRDLKRGAEERSAQMGEAVVISPTIIVVIFFVGRDEFLQYFLQILNQTGLVLDRGEGCRGARDKKRSQAVLDLFFFDLLLDLSRDVYD